MIGTDVRSYSGLDMTYCIFGQKIRDWQSWSLLSPLHVWVEPPGNAKWRLHARPSSSSAIFGRSVGRRRPDRGFAATVIGLGAACQRCCT